MLRPCYACGDEGWFRLQGRVVCSECFDELANGVIRNQNINTGCGRVRHIIGDVSPGQANAIRSMEENRE